MMDWLVNVIGTHLLPFQNPRVVAPPGTILPNGRPNVIIATPKRSGTHLAIDMIVNNNPHYRRKPIYVDLDMLAKRRNLDCLERLTGTSGYVVKTHFPIGVHNAEEMRLRVEAVAENAVIVTIRRTADDIIRSLDRWNETEDSESVLENLRQFWAFWETRATLQMEFTELFQPKGVQKLLSVCPDWDVQDALRFPRPATSRGLIYVNKAIP